jgi:hypothetical protein
MLHRHYSGKEWRLCQNKNKPVWLSPGASCASMLSLKIPVRKTRLKLPGKPQRWPNEWNLIRRRKLIQFAISRQSYASARESYSNMPETGRDEPVTRYLMYKLGIRSGDSEFGKDTFRYKALEADVSSCGVPRSCLSKFIERRHTSLRMCTGSAEYWQQKASYKCFRAGSQHL